MMCCVSNDLRSIYVFIFKNRNRNRKMSLNAVTKLFVSQTFFKLKCKSLQYVTILFSKNVRNSYRYQLHPEC